MGFLTSGLGLTELAIWKLNHQMQELSLSLTLCHSALQMNLKKKIIRVQEKHLTSHLGLEEKTAHKKMKGLPGLCR